MSITHELREYALGWDERNRVRRDLAAIADSIDAEHETTELQKESYRLDLKAANIAVGEAYNRGFDEGFASADDWLAQHEGAMAEHGWVRLPKDADGVPIRFGDKVTVSWSEKVYEVRGFSYTEQLAGGERTIWVDAYSLEKMRNIPLCGASSCHHHHTPTVEDLIRDAILSCIGHSPEYWDEPIAECATKLQLKEDE